MEKRMKPQPVVTDVVEPIDEDFRNDSVAVGLHELGNIDTQNTVPGDVHTGNNSVRDNTFRFKVPEAPEPTTNRRRSVRIQRITEKRKSVVPKAPSPPPIKRRRTTITKKPEPQSRIGILSCLTRRFVTFFLLVHSVTKAEHCKKVLDLLNKGDMKAIQVLAQIGLKTAYCIITHRYCVSSLLQWCVIIYLTI